MTNTKNTPIESFLRHYPFRITAYGLGTDSGEEFIGGQGIVRKLDFLADATVTLIGERRRIQPRGRQSN